MSIKKVTLASLILLSLTACSSGSGGGSANVAAPNTNAQTSQEQKNQESAEKAAKEKAAKEKAEAERLAAEKAAKEKAEAERLAAEKAAKEKAEAERLAAEKEAKEKAEAERLAAEKAAKEKAEAERLAAEKAAEEKAEEDRLNSRFEALKQGAIASGLSEDLVLQIQSMVANPPLNDYLLNDYEKALNNAKVLAETGKALTVNTDFHQDKIAQESLNSTTHSPASAEKFFLDTFKGIDSDLYTSGLNRGQLEESAKTTFHTDYVFQRVEGSRDDIYNQKYSVVKAQYYRMDGTYNNIPVTDEGYNVYQISGLNTRPDNIPNEGRATYQGAAFNGHEQGNLTYKVNFMDRTGEGSVSALSKGNVILKSTKLDDLLTLSGEAETENGHSGSYSLEFFGPKAEEVSGKMSLEGGNYGLAGTRGEIQK